MKTFTQNTLCRTSTHMLHNGNMSSHII